MDFCFPLQYESVSDCGRLRWHPNGIGSSSIAENCEFLIWTAMRPSVFLSLSTPLCVPRKSLEWLLLQASEGVHFKPPSLICIDGLHSPYPLVVKHDGRHRAMMALHLVGDFEIPVLIGFNDIINCNDIIFRMRDGMRAQKNAIKINGPLFSDFYFMEQSEEI